MNIPIPYSKRYEFWNWCHDNHIICEYHGSYDTYYEKWFIKNDQHRLWAVLRWL